ncbi:MAG: HAD family hydrolase [Lachnospiraceae bacterium]
MKYRHIVFDIDGTLIDTEYAVLRSLQETVRVLSGREIPYSELTFALGITGADALKKLDIKNISYAAELWNKNMRKYADTVKVFDGITELLKNLLRLDCEMGIVTSKTREEFKQDFSHFNISHYFKTIVCADDTQRHKPNAAPLLKYLEISKADCRQTLYIGDSKYDSMCAENAGIDFALAVWGSRQTSIKADYFLKNPMDLLSLQ